MAFLTVYKTGVKEKLLDAQHTRIVATNKEKIRMNLNGRYKCGVNEKIYIIEVNGKKTFSETETYG